MSNSTLDQDYFILLGIALHQAQKIEFALYGLAAHLGHTEEAKKDKRFSNLTAQDFLSNDPEKRELRKATLGQIYRLFGDILLLSGDVLESFINQRNLIVHEFFREVCTPKGCHNIDDPKKYLLDFIEISQLLEKAILGLVSLTQEAAAQKENRIKELFITQTDKENRKLYKGLVTLNILNSNKKTNQ